MHFKRTAEFKRSVKRMRRRGKTLDKLEVLLRLLAQGKPLPVRYRDHKLAGNYADCRECHIEPDWILIYQFDSEGNCVMLIDTGTHADLF
ncbi:MAG: type II toxin-antitoxin system YafQ family toxin [Myxococcota bacterium]